MSDNSLIKGNTLYKAGISQEERQLTALLASLPVDSRTRKEIYEFFREYAQEISYYNLQNEKEGVWDHFIPGLSATSQEVVPFDNIVTYWKKLGLSENELQRPHVSLILVFIELFELLKGQLNQLSKQHLDYYYKRVLQIDHRRFQPDQVYIQFKIQESLHDYLLPKGTQLSAGVDAFGNPLAYALDEDVLLNQASIREICTLLVDHSGGELIYTSSIQNTAKEDTKPIKDGVFWPPFGEPQYNKSGTEKTMTLSNVGWCIASHSLYMQEGERVVTSTLDFGAAALDKIFDYLTSPAETKIRDAKTSLAQGTSAVEEPLNNALTNVELLDFPTAISELSTALYEAKSLSLSSATVDAITGAITEVEKVKDHLKTRFEVFFSGETAWIPATIISVKKITDGYDKLEFTVRLENTQPAVTAYHKTLDVDYPLSTGQPCMKVILKQTSDHNIYTKLKNLTLNRVLLDVTVTGMTQLHLFNDSWEIDHEKPFYPFETDPEIGSHFYIGCKELFQKSTDTVTLNMNWQQVPEILRDHYKDYYGVLVLPAQKKIREAIALVSENSTVAGEKAPIITSGTTGRDLVDGSASSQKVYTITVAPSLDTAGSTITYTYAITGADANLLAVDSSTGDVTLTAAPNITTKSSYSFGVSATDSNGITSAVITVTFSIITLTSLPVITSGITGRDLIDGSASSQKVYTITAAPNSDEQGNSITYTYGISGTDASLLAVDNSTGDVTLTAAPDYTIKSSYSFNVTATDSNGITSAVITVTFSIINIPTVIGLLENTAIAVAALDLTKAKEELAVAASITQPNHSTSSTTFENAITAAKTEVESVESTLSLIANDSFKAEVHILDQGSWQPTESNTAIPLFDTTDARTTNTVNFSFPDGLTGLTSAQKKELDTSNFTLNSRNGFLRLTVSDPTFIEGKQPFSAFGYEKYPEIFSTITENNTTIISERIIAENKQNVVEAHNQTLPSDTTPLPIPFIGPEIPPLPLPKEPYEPILKQFSLSYTAQETISLSAGSASESKCYQIHPFGHKVLDQPVPPLPQYTLNDDSNANGNLYIGFENLQSKQSVSLLIKMTDGYVNTTQTTDKKIIEWCYLKENNWIPFGEKQLLHDGTDGFKHSGLVNIALPDDAQDGNHHLMPSGLKWIQIKTNRNTEEIEKIMSITTQAGSATFLNQENDLSHLAASLPAASITELVVENANIDQIIQPYPSFGGRGSESESSYYTRVSERLRHKNRAITPWDYERLVLEQFPQIHRVKCIRNTNQHGELRAGYLTLVVIPKTIHYQSGNRYQPKASRTDLLSIQEYISSKASPHTTIEVANPSYETLTIDCEVGFIDQLSVGQYKKQLDEDLKKLFSPWAYDDQNSITFSDVMYRSQILLYIENRPYINYVSQLKITQTGKQVTSKGISHMRIVASRTDEYDFTIAGSYIFTDQSIIRVQSERSIFVTAAEHTIKEHRINIPPVVLDGINYWAVETDFTVF